MATKATIDVEVLLGQFNSFKADLDKVMNTMGNISSTWKKMNEEIKKASEGGKKFDEGIKPVSNQFKSMSTYVSSITSGFKLWPTLLRPLNMMLGALGIEGIGVAAAITLARTVSDRARMAAGVGMTYGQYRGLTAMTGTYFDDPAAVARNLGAARFDITSPQRLAFANMFGQGAQAELEKGPTAIFDYMDQMAKRLKGTPEGAQQTMFNTFGGRDVVDFGAYKQWQGMSPEQQQKARDDLAKAVKESSEVNKKATDDMRDLTTAVNELKVTIETNLIKALDKVAGPLAKWVEKVAAGDPTAVTEATVGGAAGLWGLGKISKGIMRFLGIGGRAAAGAGAAEAGAAGIGAGAEIAGGAGIGAFGGPAGAIVGALAAALTLLIPKMYQQETDKSAPHATPIPWDEWWKSLKEKIIPEAKPIPWGEWWKELQDKVVPEATPIPWSEWWKELKDKVIPEATPIPWDDWWKSITDKLKAGTGAVQGAFGNIHSFIAKNLLPSGEAKAAEGTDATTPHGRRALMAYLSRRKGVDEGLLSAAGNIDTSATIGPIAQQTKSTDTLTKSIDDLTFQIKMWLGMTSPAASGAAAGGGLGAFMRAGGGGAAGAAAIGGSPLIQEIGKGTEAVGALPGGKAPGVGGPGDIRVGTRGPGALPPKLDPSRKASAQIVANEFRKAGASEEGIAGMFANIQSESGFKASIMEPGGTGVGLWQFSGTSAGSEKGRMLKWMADNNKDWRDPQAQAEYQVQNLQKNYPKLWQEMKTHEAAGLQAGAYLREYEKPRADYAAQRAGAYARGVPSVEAYTGKTDTQSAIDKAAPKPAPKSATDTSPQGSGYSSPVAPKPGPLHLDNWQSPDKANNVSISNQTGHDVFINASLLAT